MSDPIEHEGAVLVGSILAVVLIVAVIAVLSFVAGRL